MDIWEAEPAQKKGDFYYLGYSPSEINNMIAFYNLHHSPNSQTAFDLDVLLDDIQNRIAFDNQHIGRHGDDLSKRVREMREKLIGIIKNSC